MIIGPSAKVSACKSKAELTLSWQWKSEEAKPLSKETAAADDDQGKLKKSTYLDPYFEEESWLTPGNRGKVI